MALATSGHFKGWLDVEDAKATLKFVAEKESTRALKRKAEAELAAEQESARMHSVGAARVRARAMIASRPVKTRRVVDLYGRAHVF